MVHALKPQEYLKQRKEIFCFHQLQSFLMPYLSLPMSSALADMVEGEIYTCPVPEKLGSCSKQHVVEEKEDVPHSSLLASFCMARAQTCEGWRNQRGFLTLLSSRSLHPAAEAL